MSDILDERIRKTLRKLHPKDMAEYLDEALEKLKNNRTATSVFSLTLLNINFTKDRKDPLTTASKKRCSPET